MSAILPPSAAAATPPNSGAPVVVTAVGDAKAVAALQAGSILEVVTQSRPSKGVLEVMTADGPLQLKVQPPATLPPIPEGARLLLQVGNNGGLNLLAINGRPLAGVSMPGMAAPGMVGGPLLGGGVLGGGGLAGPVLGNTGAPGQATPQPTSTPNNPLAGPSTSPTFPAPAATPGITATLIRPAQPDGAAVPNNGPPSSTLPPNLPPGTQLTVRIAGIEPAPTPPPNPAQPGTAPAAAGPNAAPPIPQRPVPGPALPLPPQSSSTPTATSMLAGSVTAHPPGGQAVLSTAIGTVSLPTAEALPIGTIVKLDVVAPPNLPPLSPMPTAARPEGLSPQGWPALSEAMETLAGNDRQALDLMMRAIPTAGPRLAAAMVAFTGAMRSGDSRGVVGDSTNKALEKAGRRDLVERLKADLSDLATESGRVVGGGEWRMHTMPFCHGAQVDPIRLFVRGAGAEEQKRQSGGTGNDQRFILDFHLSNLGRLQMDGLVRREDKLFDLIIRTGTALPQTMRMDIMAIFTQASELVGTKGSVAFQAGGRWIDIRTDETGPTRIEV